MSDGQTEVQENLTLRLWEGDETVLAELVMAWALKIEIGIRKEFEALTPDDAEDVVAEAISRFWAWREQYDPDRAKIQTVLWKLARQVACEVCSGKYHWQKVRLREKSNQDSFIELIDRAVNSTSSSESATEPDGRLQKAVKEAFSSLSELQQDILRAYADAGDYPVDAAALGRELGDKHNGGVPMPGGTIRVYKKRAKDTMVSKLKRDGFDLKAMGYTHE